MEQKMQKTLLSMLSKPLVTFDLEATGLDVDNDRIIEIGITKIYPNGTKDTKCRLVNPTIEIPLTSIEIHGITNEMVATEPTFKSISKGILDFISGCDIAGFNSNRFDVPMLYAEFQRSGIDWDYKQHNFIDVGNIHKILNPRTLGQAYKQYTGEDLDGSHRSEADANATLAVLEYQIALHEELPTTIEELALYSNFGEINADIKGLIKVIDGKHVWAVGKYKGLEVGLDASYCHWVVERSTFPNEVKAICAKYIY